MNLNYGVDGTEILETTTDLMAAYLMRNKLSVDDMCTTIANVYTTLYDLSRQDKPLSYKELLNGGIVEHKA